MVQYSLKMEYNNSIREKQFNMAQVENLQRQTQIIEGYFPKELYEKEMYIRKINTTLCVLLAILIAIAMFSYYFVTVSEMTLNNLSKETISLNDENAELQYKLDKLKSFSNVDMTMQKNKTLTRAKQVLEVPEVNSTSIVDKKISREKIFSYAIGY